jgi:FRG domain-containing protein
MSDPTELLNLDVKDFKGLFEAIFWMSRTTTGKLWWRGQEQDWDLLPSVHRPAKRFEESFLTFNFMRKAQSRYTRCPNQGDFPSWLFLMQHYGLPTRLLDWSASPMVALFFAFENFNFLKNEDSVLWGLDPVALNEQQLGVRMISSAHNDSVLPLFVDAYRQPTDQIASQQIVAVVTDELDVRQLLQQSMFTIHGSTVPLNRLPGHEKFLRRIRILKEANS